MLNGSNSATLATVSLVTEFLITFGPFEVPSELLLCGQQAQYTHYNTQVNPCRLIGRF